jgi:hypothetical protein
LENSTGSAGRLFLGNSELIRLSKFLIFPGANPGNVLIFIWFSLDFL